MFPCEILESTLRAIQLSKLFFPEVFFYAANDGSNFHASELLSDPDHSNESYWAALSCGVPFVALYKMALAFKSFQSVCSAKLWTYFAL